MTTTERLQKIKAKCQELLAIAEKRTPGEWVNTISGSMLSSYPVVITTDKPVHVEACESDYPENTAFIASCAGPAEAGWKATIAAIESAQAFEVEWIGHYMLRDAILAAWPEELL